MAFKENLAAQFVGVSPEHVLLSVSAASVVVVARIVTPDASVAAAVASELSSTGAAELSQALGHTIESVSAPTVATVPFAAPSPPPPSPPFPSPPPCRPPVPPPPWLPETATNLASDEDTASSVLVIGIVSGALSALVVVASAFYLRRKCRHERAPKFPTISTSATLASPSSSARMLADLQKVSATTSPTAAAGGLGDAACNSRDANEVCYM